LAFPLQIRVHFVGVACITAVFGILKVDSMTGGMIKWNKHAGENADEGNLVSNSALLSRVVGTANRFVSRMSVLQSQAEHKGCVRWA